MQRGSIFALPIYFNVPPSIFPILAGPTKTNARLVQNAPVQSEPLPGPHDQGYPCLSHDRDEEDDSARDVGLREESPGFFVLGGHHDQPAHTAFADEP